MKSLKDHIQEKKMDPVGKADADIDNDGDVDSSDKYLHNRRKAIKKAMKKESATFQYTVAKHLAKKDGHDYDRLPEYDRTHNKHKDHYNDQAKKKIAAGHFDKGIHETEIHFNADDKNNSKSASAFVRHLSSKGIEAHKAGGSMHRSIVKVTSKNRAHHDYAKKKVAGRYDVNVRSEETKPWKKDSGWKKTNKPGTVTDKSGAKHTPMSRAKHLAKQGMKNAFNKEEVGLDEVMSSPARAAHRGMFKAALGKAQDQNSQKDRLARLKKKGWVKNDRGGMSKVSEEDIVENTEALKKKASKSGISVSTLRKVYNRGVAAWRTGHRPGTTPAQWGMARVNSYITKGKGTYHGADKDLREDVERHADVKMVKTKAPDGRPIWKKQRKETEVSKHNEGVDYHHISQIENVISEFVGIEKLQEALNRLQQMKFAKAAKELKAYAKKRGGIDKKDFMMVAQLMDDGEAMELAKFVKKMDTDPREYVHTLMSKHGLMKKR